MQIDAKGTYYTKQTIVLRYNLRSSRRGYTGALNSTYIGINVATNVHKTFFT